MAGFSEVAELEKLKATHDLILVMRQSRKGACAFSAPQWNQ